MVETSILDVIGCKANVLCTIGRMTLPKMIIRSEDRLAIKWTIRMCITHSTTILSVGVGHQVGSKHLDDSQEL